MVIYMGRSSPPASLEEAAWRNRHKRDVDTQTPPQTGAGWEVGCHEGSTNFPCPYEHRWLGGGGSGAWTKEEGSNKSGRHMAEHGHAYSDLVSYLLSVCICPLTPWTLLYMWVFYMRHLILERFLHVCFFSHETLFYRSFFYMCVFYMRHFLLERFFTWEFFYMRHFLPELFYMCVFYKWVFLHKYVFYRTDFFVPHIGSALYNQDLPMNI
jgi:hypothetical protein